MPVLPSYRNQSVDFHRKSIYWFMLLNNLAFNGLKSNQNEKFLYNSSRGSKLKNQVKKYSFKRQPHKMDKHTEAFRRLLRRIFGCV